MIKKYLHDNWTMRQAGHKTSIPAQVPGSVYGDLLHAGLMEDPFWKDNEDKVLPLMDHDYQYSCVFDCSPDLLACERILLHFDGLDTITDLYLNNQKIGHTENMHRCFSFEVKDYLKEKDNHLSIIFYSPTKYIADAFAKAPTLGTADAMNGFVHIRKAHCMFGWDWGAHLPDAGIWRPVSLLGFSSRIEDMEILQFHENKKVTLEVRITAAKTPSLTKVSIIDPEGSCVYQEEKEMDATNTLYSMEVPNPKLWWPNGYGDQPLYTVKVELYDLNHNLLDTNDKRIGLRTITMDRPKDQWGERFATCINGVNIFAMGADYIPEDHLLGRITPETTRSLLEKAIFANFNSIRVWGGGYYPDDWFFDLCDEMGLIVWQDFMFACAVYDLTPEFEENITEEIIDNLKRIRHHACLGLLCGNNEMEQFVLERNWVSKESEVRDYLIMYERIFPQLVKTYAPQVFYWPASPSSGGSFDDPRDENRGDVHYWDVWHGNKPFSEYRNFHFRYLSEFGFQSFPARKTVDAFTDDPRDRNIFSYVFEKHQRNASANGKIMNYMQQTYRYPTDFDTLLYASQLLQADAIRYGVEHFRRHRNDSRCMGAVYWQFNDCWPVASWSSVDYCGRLKVLHYAARRFFAPIMISCEEEGMLGSGQELVQLPFDIKKSIRLNITNESLTERHIIVRWQLRDASAKILRMEEEEVLVPALTSVWLARVELPQAKLYDEYVSYQAYDATDKNGEPLSEGTVIFSYPKYFHYKDPELSHTLSKEGPRTFITVRAKAYAKSVEILNENEDLILSDNYFDLNADTKTVEVLKGDVSQLRLRSVYNIN